MQTHLTKFLILNSFPSKQLKSFFKSKASKLLLPVSKANNEDVVCDELELFTTRVLGQSVFNQCFSDSHEYLVEVTKLLLLRDPLAKDKKFDLTPQKIELFKRHELQIEMLNKTIASEPTFKMLVDSVDTNRGISTLNGNTSTVRFMNSNINELDTMKSFTLIQELIKNFSCCLKSFGFSDKSSW